jgi:CRP-like cAMP-binding protein
VTTVPVDEDHMADGPRSRWTRIAGGPARLAEPLQILRGNRSLTWLVVAFGALTVAEWGYVTALAVDALRRDGPIAVGFVGFRLIFAAFGSVLSLPYVERHPGARLLTAVAGTRAAIVGVSAALAAAGAPIAVLLALVALDAIASGPYRAAQSTLLPVLARTPRELAASAAGVSIVKTLAQALGGTSGGLLLAAISPAAAFSGAAVLLLFAGVVTTRFTHVVVPTPIAMHLSGLGERTRATLDAVREPHVAPLLTVSGLRTFVRGMWMAIAVIASIRLLHAGSTGVGLLMLAAGIGSLVAVPLSGGLIQRTRLGNSAAVALIACGAPLAVMAAVPRLDVAFFLVVVWGIGMAVADVATLSLLYRVLDVPLLPRVTTLIESSKLALEGVGGLVAPLLVSAFNVRTALVVAAVPLPVVVLVGWRMLHRLDASAGERTNTLTLLHRVPCLQPLDMAALGLLATAIEPVSVAEGIDVVLQGEHGDRFYVVKEGSADILVDGYPVGRVEQAGSFGERALLRDVPRTATVRAREPMQLLALSREAFLAGLTGQESVGVLSPVPASSGAGARDVDSLAAVLARLPLFSHLDSPTLRRLAELAVVDSWEPGAAIVRQGEHGDRFFVLLDGEATASVDGRVLNGIRPGDQFGEIALLHDVPRTATVTASVAAATLSLDRVAFTSAVRDRILLG